jgi:hypothetical protein
LIANLHDAVIQNYAQMKTINTLYKIVLILTILVLFANTAASQGPELPYFYTGKAHLPWAEGSLKFKSGSSIKTGFFPLAGSTSGPYGTNSYTSDVFIDKQLVFVPSIHHRKGYDDQAVEIKERVVLYCPELEQFSENKLTATENINQLINEGVSAIALFSIKEENPFFDVENICFPKEEIPIISLDRSTAFTMLYANGYDLESVKRTISEGKLPVMKEPIFNFHFSFKGNFDKIETEHCTIRFNKNILDSTAAIKIADNNEKALRFLYHFFAEINPVKERQLITYFSDYDEKLFYTNHWGKGLAAGKAGIFSIYDEESNDYALAVHELTHILFHNNWGRQSSFLNEGIAMYAEAESVKSDNSNVVAKKSDQITKNFLENGKLLPIEKLAELQIGADNDFTQMGYAASGSFVRFLITKYGQKSFLDLWKSESQWKSIYGKELQELEKEWHKWLKK